MRKFLLIATLLSIHTALSAGIFSWTDASGNIVYGDSPPDTVVAKSVEPPKLTILENFANRYESPNKSSSLSKPTKTSNVAKSTNPQAGMRKRYEAVTIIAPKADQSIRANDGDVSVALVTSPKLQSGDKTVIFLNGQEHSTVKSSVGNLRNLDRGEYQLSIEIRNAVGKSLIKSDEISFNVVRKSVLTNKNKAYAEGPSQ